MNEGIGADFGHSPGLYSPRPYESEGARSINYVKVVWALPFRVVVCTAFFVTLCAAPLPKTSWVCAREGVHDILATLAELVYLYWPSLHLSKLVAYIYICQQ